MGRTDDFEMISITVSDSSPAQRGFDAPADWQAEQSDTDGCGHKSELLYCIGGATATLQSPLTQAPQPLPCAAPLFPPRTEGKK